MFLVTVGHAYGDADGESDDDDDDDGDDEMMMMMVGNGGMQRVTGVTITRDWLTHGSCGALEIEGSSSIFALTDQHIFYIQGGFFSFVPGFTGIQRLGLDDGGKDVSTAVIEACCYKNHPGQHQPHL